MGEKEVARFLAGLAVEQDEVAATQHQGLSALAFVRRGVLYVELDRLRTSGRRSALVACREHVDGSSLI